MEMSLSKAAMTEADIWHSAWLMTAFFGGPAEAHRAAITHAQLVHGSLCGEDAWRRVAGVLNEIKQRRLTRAVH